MSAGVVTEIEQANEAKVCSDRLQLLELGVERSDVHDGLDARRYADLATSAMRANVAASRAPISARLLRSSSTPADLRPLMSLP